MLWGSFLLLFVDQWGDSRAPRVRLMAASRLAVCMWLVAVFMLVTASSLLLQTSPTWQQLADNTDLHASTAEDSTEQISAKNRGLQHQLNKQNQCRSCVCPENICSIVLAVLPHSCAQHKTGKGLLPYYTSLVTSGTANSPRFFI